MLNAKGISNCPNCGAPITSEKCPYCGTVFYDFSCIDFTSPTYIKIKHNGHIFMCKAMVRDCELSVYPEYSEIQKLGDPIPLRVHVMDRAEINLSFDVIPEENLLFRAVKED